MYKEFIDLLVSKSYILMIIVENTENRNTDSKKKVRDSLRMKTFLFCNSLLREREFVLMQNRI